MPANNPEKKKGYPLGWQKPGPLNQASIALYLNDFIQNDPRNHLPEGQNIRIFDEPVVGIATVSDPLFKELPKPEVVAPRHVLPEFFMPEAKSVISFFAPFSKEIKDSYRQHQGTLPPLEWISGRLNGEVFINVLRRAIWRLIEKTGGQAHIPNLDPRYNSENLVPTWSERHVAYIAGVGTFGHHCGLLTEKGAAGRIGSVLTDVVLEPTKRPYSGIYDYCLLRTGHKCGACLKKCPVRALSPEGKNHTVCADHSNFNIRPNYYNWGYHSCGHCQNKLPCSDGIPKALRKS